MKSAAKCLSFECGGAANACFTLQGCGARDRVLRHCFHTVTSTEMQRFMHKALHFRFRTSRPWLRCTELQHS